MDNVNNGLVLVSKVYSINDIKKIVRDTKFFNEDIVLKAFKLYKDLKLIFLDNDKCFRITNYENIVGSETYRSKTKKRTKKKIRVILP